jgi:hypothetical protein
MDIGTDEEFYSYEYEVATETEPALGHGDPEIWVGAATRRMSPLVPVVCKNRLTIKSRAANWEWWIVAGVGSLWLVAMVWGFLAMRWGLR